MLNLRDVILAGKPRSAVFGSCLRSWLSLLVAGKLSPIQPVGITSNPDYHKASVTSLLSGCCGISLDRDGLSASHRGSRSRDGLRVVLWVLGRGVPRADFQGESRLVVAGETGSHLSPDEQANLQRREHCDSHSDCQADSVCDLSGC
jgi:hypothetical protein